MRRVVVVDDRADFRQAFAALLDRQPDLEVVVQAGSLAEARTMFEGIDVALLDRGLPDGDGLKLMWPLREANPDAKVFVMSATAEMGHPEDAIEAGADGVIDKLASFERAFAAMRGHGSGLGCLLGLFTGGCGRNLLRTLLAGACIAPVLCFQNSPIRRVLRT